MKLKNILNKTSFTIFFVLILVTGCKSQNINFNFSGKKVLYSENIQGKIELVLLNLDTNEKIKFNNFDEVEGSTYILFNEGKKIFVSEYNSTGKVYIYDILKNAKIEIDIHSKNSDMSDFSEINISNNYFYFASHNKIFAHSLVDFSLVKEYTVDSLISQFSVHDKDLMAITYSDFDLDTKCLSISNIYLYNFKDNTKKEIPFRAYLCDWSNNGEKLLFNSIGPKTMDYPTFEIHSINIDSLEYLIDMSFIANDEIIFSGYRSGEDFNSTNLYLLNLKSKKIIQITNSDTRKEIKSTNY